MKQPARTIRAIRAVLVTALLGIALPATAAEVTIVQKDKTFSRADLQVKVGDRVTFINADTVTHNVFSATGGQEFEIRAQEPGKSTAIRFERPGSLLVECAIHPRMKLRVRVDP